MENYEVIIVGAGPAGLKCAEVLSKANIKTLILEKKEKIGPKICAGGITRKFFRIFPDFPNNLLDFSTSKAFLHSPKNTHAIQTEIPFVFTINREKLGQWQLERLKKEMVTIKTNTKVIKIEPYKVVASDNQQFGFKYLVGADGATSNVRRHLKLKSTKKVITLHYKIPSTTKNKLEVFMDDRFFNIGYAWKFPHKKYISTGCGADTRKFSSAKLKRNFHKWLANKSIDLSNATYESAPILFDYRGYKFENIFLAGEAAGFTSGLTGEGIYPALVSGEEIAKLIINPEYIPNEIKDLLHYKKIQEKFLTLLIIAGPFRNNIFNLIVNKLKNPKFTEKVASGFS